MKFSIVLAAFAATAFAQSQLGDGQVNGGATQITDGQVQAAPTPAATQKTDGQINAAPPAATQKTDGQINAPPAASTGVVPPPANGTFTTSAPSASAFTGAGSLVSWSKEIAVVAVGAAGAFILL